MSYPKDLDGYSTADLRAELDRRADARLQGRCDYCNRGLDSYPNCSFPERHQGQLRLFNPETLDDFVEAKD